MYASINNLDSRYKYDRHSFLTKKLASHSEIRKNARIIDQASRTITGSSFFKNIPATLQAKIAGLTGNPELHDEKQSENIAYENLGRPF